MDRPLGSAHPRHSDLVYPVNCGELPVSGDGHPIDAYPLGWGEPVKEARGIDIAVIVRHDGREDKLVGWGAHLDGSGDRQRRGGSGAVLSDHADALASPS
ncbi:hypothetical protein [Deinococcus frigens]|uniref:hypothetical protein n=1 Tax=Deinococcus frigens TaxID=249403 RepID=UPI001FE03DCD|nr:hypothetical protein [Deinococcus frigens]